MVISLHRGGAACLEQRLTCWVVRPGRAWQTSGSWEAPAGWSACRPGTDRDGGEPPSRPTVLQHKDFYYTEIFLVANSNSSFYSGWSLTHSVTHVSLQHAHGPVWLWCLCTCTFTFATRGFQTLFYFNWNCPPKRHRTLKILLCFKMWIEQRDHI